MASRANNWGEAEVVCLISIWQERSVANILDGKDRNNKAYEIMAQKMKEAGYTTRTAAVVQNKVKALRQAYILRHLAVNPMANLAGSPATGLTSHCESDKRSRGNIPFATAD